MTPGEGRPPGTATGTQRLAGVLAPVLTPFTADLQPDAERFVRHCRWLLEHGCSGLAVFGTTSEANSLSVDERAHLFDALLGAGVKPASILAGTGCCALPDTVRLTRLAVKAGCAGVLVLPPFFYKGVSDDGLFRSYAELIERVGDERLRLYLYHIPQLSQVGITMPVIERLLAAYPRAIAGAKDSSGNWENTRAMLDAFARSGFDVFVGTEKLLLDNLRNGGAGTISATANVNAAAIDRVYRGWKGPGADALQAEINVIRGILEKQPAIPALKQVVAHFSKDETWRAVRPPLTQLSPQQTEGLLAALREAGFAMPGLS